MKHIHLFLAAVICLMFGSTLQAQTQPQEVTLTVSSDGPSKDEATKNALRSAIEQTYGAFVSANTSILNDEMVKDEIVTVSNGSIKDYTEVSSVPDGKGGYFVTLTATVSLPHLITYAKNHGSECEFAGNTFGMEMKLLELQKENELKALYNLTDQVIAMLPNELHYDIEIGEPSVAQDLPEYSLYDGGKLISRYSRKPHNDWSIRYDTIYDSSLTTGYKFSVDSVAHSYLMKLSRSQRDQTALEYYSIPLTIYITSSEFEREDGWRNPDRISDIYATIYNTLDALALSEDQVEVMRKRNMEYSELHRGKRLTQYFRNSKDEIRKWMQNLYFRASEITNDFVIKDNTGTTSIFYPLEILNRYYYPASLTRDDVVRRVNSMYDNILMISEREEAAIFGEGLFHDVFKFKYGNPGLFNYHYTEIIPGTKLYHLDFYDCVITPIVWELTIYIPKADISKYSKFWVEPNHK
ncbi:MAG: LPP20 family lipoprotein [Muribaculaceae bacterium]|nr:LPP20 family lipoprotein [Muribaculaceae bacterium]